MTITSTRSCRAALAAAAVACAPATALTGVSVEGQPVFGELGVNLDNSDPFDDIDFISQIQDTGTIGPELEIVLVDPHMTGDFSTTGDTLTVHLNAGFGVFPFNGLRFELTDPDAPTILDASLVGSTYPGFDETRLFFQGRRIALNCSGLSGVGDITIAIAYEDGPPPCTGDIDADGTVGITDLLALLAAWGPNPGHPADLDGDDVVGITDLLALLAAWGPCPGG